MAKSIKESYGPVQYHNSQTMLEKESRNCGDNCQCDPLNSEDEPYCNCVAEGKSDERRAKIARAAKAGAENKAKEKAKATEKHNQNSAKSRAGVDYLKKGGNKDQFGRVRKEEFEITESDKAEYDKLMKQYGDMPASKIPPKTYMRISQLGRKVRGDKGGPKVGDLLKSMKKRKMGEDITKPSGIEKRRGIEKPSGIEKAAMRREAHSVENVDEATKKPSKIKKGTTFFDKKVPETKPKPSILKRKYSEETNEATNKFPKWWEDDPRAVLTKVYHAKRQLPPKLDKKSWQKIVNVLHDKRPAPLADYRRWSKMDPVKIQSTGSMKPKGGKQSAGKHDMSDAPIKGFKRDSSGKVIGEESIKINGGSAVEIGKNERGSKTQYYWKDKSGLKNVFDTPQKLRYSLRNDANFSGAEKAVKQLLGEAKMGDIRRNVKKGDSPYTVVAIVNNKVVDQDHAKIPDQVPALVRELKKEYPNAKISVEDRGGRVVHSEAFSPDKASGRDMIKKDEYQKLMKKYGNTPITKVPPKDFAKITMLGNDLRKAGLIESQQTDERRDREDDEGHWKQKPQSKRERARNVAIVRAGAAKRKKEAQARGAGKKEVKVDEGGLGNSSRRTKPSQKLNISRKEK